MRSRIQIVLLTAAATIASAAVLPPPSPLVLNPSSPSQQPPVIATLTPSLLQTTTIATNSTLTPPLLATDFPGHEHFKINFQLGTIFLPPESVLLNVLQFMSIVARQTFDQKLAPRTYSTPGYRNVQITSFAWTEPRFLLWGIFYVIDFMIDSARFHEVLVELYWENNVVGRLKIAAGAPRSISEVGEATQDLATTGDESVKAEGGVSDHNTVVPLATLNASAAAISVRPPYSIYYEGIPDATKVNRNDLFELFYAAIDHVAQYSVGSLMREFQTTSPNGQVMLRMKELELGCQVS